MTAPLVPRDAAEVEEAVRWALGAGKTLEVTGRGSKRTLGRPAQTDATLDLSALAGVTLYEPRELVLSARAATPIAAIAALVAENGQELAFEPMDCSALLGGPAREGTLGGVLATNLSGPRRIKAGAARDHFLGFSAVSGRGETFKAGGRVVKNVTGYDLSKLMAGSFGTLAAMTEVTIKTLPRAETEASVLLLGLAPEAAVPAMAAAMGSPFEVSGAAHLPAGVAARTGVPGLPDGKAVTALRLEGVGPSVAHRRDGLLGLLAPHGTRECLAVEASRQLWGAIRDVTPFATRGEPDADRPVWRISTAPSRGAELAAMIAGADEAEVLLDWAGGLVWAAVAPSADAGAATVRAATAHCGGHATLIRASAAVRAAVDVFEPQRGPLAVLTRRVKESFDPRGVLCPGRMWVGV
ncbi:FAD-binding protein [Rhodoplanes sp. TEM]|uniref:FAD-binding protein n=1 Tax=Rhodoplanes tepidamans TaxID=200616 RepID=A0ABT5JJQ6_RHOTP|nr:MULTISPECIES: FAD-binding protein [Rhodoplanes]MDC7789588.1 FAD-binding protein [Rhodoplanes tepidamans]MDC7985658.1 FAD-binding protein [Rhodoplanes sp. TEM]MDQ0357268.1 glycolate oxidase FAD binding subunit [Rhodoplanes tepidamans]